MISLFSQLANQLGDAAFKDFMVENLSNLLTMQTPNYLHKLVWVKSEKTFYFLISGDGSLLSHWERYSPSATNFVVPPYNSASIYGLGSLVHYRSKLYMGLVTPIGQNNYPDINPTKWLDIGTGDGSGTSVRAKTFDIPLTFEINDTDSKITRLSNIGAQSRYQLNHQLGSAKIDINSYLLTNNGNESIQISHTVLNRDNIIVFLRGTDKPIESIRVYVIPISTYTNDTVIVWAGIDQTITGTDVDLEGVAIALEESTLAYTWSKISGPDVVISSPNTISTQVLGLTAGNTYTFRLSVLTSSNDQTYYDDVIITVI